MTDLWCIKHNDFLHFETLKCPEKLCREILLLSAGTPVIKLTYLPYPRPMVAEDVSVTSSCGVVTERGVQG